MNNKKRLKIGLFIDNFFPNIDGVVLVVDNLAKELSKDNDVVVVSPYIESYEDDLNRGYKVVRVGSYSVPFSEYHIGKLQTRLSSKYKYLLEENFDIIHIHSPFIIGKLGLSIAKEMNIPCICTVHTRFDYEIRRVVDSDIVVNKIMKNIIKVFNKCDRCIVVNDPMIKEIKRFGYKYRPVVIYNGTDLKKLDNNNKYIEKINKQYKLDNTPVLLFVGRIIEIKNIFFILDSLKLLKEDNFKFKMIFVGTGPDENKFKEKIKEYHMEDDIIMTGKITDRDMLSSIYERADLLLFPSLFDTSSLVRIEAAVNETPGLFIKGSMVGDTIIDNIDGYVTKLDVVTYKNKIKEIFENKELLDRVSKNARVMLGKSWKEITKETYELYLKEINRK